jgi:hypothetical protein
MKKLLSTLIIILIYSCSSNNEDMTQEQIFNEFLTVDYTSSIDSGNYITLEYYSKGSVTIDWGDGEIEKLIIGNFFGKGNPKKHNYNSKQSYNIKISGSEQLIDLRIKTNLKNDTGFVTKINVLGMNSLYTLIASNNKISQINLNDNSELRVLELFNNNLTSLNLSNNDKLKWSLNISNNQITNLNIDNLIDLEMLYVRDNNLTNLDLSNNLKLDLIGLNNNPNLYCIKIASNQLINTIDKDANQEFKTNCN